MRRFFVLMTITLVAAGCRLSSPGPDSDAGMRLDIVSPTKDFGWAPACFSRDFPDPAPAAPAELASGNFAVRMDEAGRVEIRWIPSSRIVFESPPDGLLHAALVDAFMLENQGSFSLKETVACECSRMHVQEVGWDGKNVGMRGFFEGPGCENQTFSVVFCEVSPGHLGFHVRTTGGAGRVTLRAASTRDEVIFGGGEQFPHHTLDLKGRRWPVWAQEGGVGRGHPVITPLVDAASPGSGGSEGTTYFAVPHIITSRMRSLTFENTEPAVFDFTAPDVLELHVYADDIQGRVLVGDSPLELVERFTEYAGRMPPPPAWSQQGAVVALARDTQSSLEIVDRLLAGGVRIAAIWNQTWSGRVNTFVGEQVLWNWAYNPLYHPEWDAFVGHLASLGIRTLCYANPMLVPMTGEMPPVARDIYAEALSGGHLLRGSDGSVMYFPVTAFSVALVDLSSPGARQWFGEVLREELLEKAGCSGWMADFSEAFPFDAAPASKENPWAYHNRFPVEWVRLNREVVESAGRAGDVLVFSRAGHTRTPAYALMVWEGDQLTTWDSYDGLASALHGLLAGGFSGISLNHSDIGGYTAVAQWGLGYSREAELLKRWTELSAFTALMRTHEGNRPAENAQVYDSAESIAHFARFTKVFSALAFYRERLFDEAARYGWPVVRHLWMHYPQDPQALHIHDQFLLGNDILVAPQLEKCHTWPVCIYERRAYLPPGRWVHLWSGQVQGRETAGEWVTVRAPIGEPAVWYRLESETGPRLVQKLRIEGISVPTP